MLYRGGRGALRIGFVVACSVLGACGHCTDDAIAPPVAAGASRTEQWRGDLHVLARELPQRHKNAFFQISEATWRRDVDDLDRRIPELDDAHITAGIVRLVAAIGDAHTTVYPERHRVYPLVLEWFSDGIFVTGADRPWAIGKKLTGIGAHPITEVIAALRPLVSHDTEQNIRAWLPMSLIDPVRLAGTDLADADHAVFQLAAADGSVRALELRPGEPVARTLPASRPLYLQNPADFMYWNKYSEADHLLYLAYDECTEDAHAGPFAKLAAGTLAFADQHSVDRFVIDLRHNGGGNEAIIKPLIDGLAERPGLAGRVFAIISMYTFSSANQNAMELKRRLLATLVGGTTGARSSGYGEVKRLVLPSSGLRMQYSTRYFANPGYPTDTVEPDIPVEVTSHDWFSGHDPIMDAILAVPLPPRVLR
jgi:hypothetical protein